MIFIIIWKPGPLKNKKVRHGSLNNIKEEFWRSLRIPETIQGSTGTSKNRRYKYKKTKKKQIIQKKKDSQKSELRDLSLDSILSKKK